MDVFIQSYEPRNGYLIGYCISHSEASSLAYFLSNDHYRPSVYYVYQPCPMAIKGLMDVAANNFEMLDKYYVYSGTDLTAGFDSVGAYMIFEQDGQLVSYWSGTILDVKDAAKISPHVTATSIQVAAGVLSAVDYCIHNPNKGVLFPEFLDTERVFELVVRSWSAGT